MGRDGVLTGVRLQDGTELSCELAVVAVGIAPNVTLARNAGISIGTTGGLRLINTCRHPILTFMLQEIVLSCASDYRKESIGTLW